MTDVTSRFRTRHASRLGAAALTGALVLTGCGVSGLDRAATVNGRDIAISDLQEAVQQYSQISPVEINQVLTVLVLLPVLDDAAAGTQGQLPDERLRTWANEQGLGDPSETTLDYLRGLSYLNNEQLLTAVTVEDLDALEIDINPRFGEWDGSNYAIAPGQPDWIIPADGGGAVN